jgi:hypothetical protein
MGRTASIDYEISTAMLLSGVSMEATHSLLMLLKIATNHNTTSYRYGPRTIVSWNLKPSSKTGI